MTTYPYQPPERMYADTMLFGPRNSTVRHLRGDTVTHDELIRDTSELGWWSAGDPLRTRPAELWVDQVYDACGGDW